MNTPDDTLSDWTLPDWNMDLGKWKQLPELKDWTVDLNNWTLPDWNYEPDWTLPNWNYEPTKDGIPTKG